MKSDAGTHLPLSSSPSFPKLFFGTLGACMLVFSVFPATLLQAPVRLDNFWNRADTAALMLDYLVLALAVAAALWGLGRLTHGRAFRLGRRFLPFLYAIGLMQLLPQATLRKMGLDGAAILAPYAVIAATGFALSLFSCRGRRDAALGKLGAFLPAFALICPLLGVQLFCCRPFVAFRTLDEGPVPDATVPAPNILVFSFDSIPMAACLDPGGDWRGDIPCTRAFQEQAIRFDEARSGGEHTLASVPRFLLQDGRGIYAGTPLVNTMWDDAFFGADIATCTNGILAMARTAGYRTSALTLYLPLGQLAGGLLDGVRDIPRTRFFPATSFAARCLNHFVAMLDCFRPRLDGLARATHGRFPWPPHRLAHDYFVRLCRDQIAAAHAHIARLPASGELFYAHLAGAHPPCILREDGTPDEATATYDTQLRYTDSVFGGFLDDLQRHGRYDDAWIIFTSDHGRNGVPGTPAQRRHVPFVVKPPRWSRPIVSDTPLAQWELSDFFRAVMEGKSVEECVNLLPAAGGHEEPPPPARSWNARRSAGAV